jgi:hypothetical protein
MAYPSDDDQLAYPSLKPGMGFPDRSNSSFASPLASISNKAFLIEGLIRNDIISMVSLSYYIPTRQYIQYLYLSGYEESLVHQLGRVPSPRNTPSPGKIPPPSIKTPSSKTVDPSPSL